MTLAAAPLPAEQYRAELVGYCYRFFGSYPEAEDAVQETMVRAWQRADRFDHRSSLRTWLYRIATNICIDMNRAPQRRALPMDLGPAGVVPDDPSTLRAREPATWIGPISDAYLPGSGGSGDPAEAVALRESVRLAFLVALQRLPPRQRAVLILRDVLDWSAAECADLLGMSVPSVNSALARARRTVGIRAEDPGGPAMSDAAEQHLLRDYVTAFEAFDVDRLVTLLREDAVFAMPPYELWLQGTGEIEKWWRGPGQVCRDSRVIVTRANARPAAAVYHRVAPNRFDPFALHLLDMAGGRICAITHFMGPAVFSEFHLPARIVTDGSERPALDR